MILTYKGNEDEAQAVVRQIEARGRRAAALQLDLADSRGFAAFAERVKRVLASTWQRERVRPPGRAGIGLHASFAETSSSRAADA